MISISCFVLLWFLYKNKQFQTETITFFLHLFSNLKLKLYSSIILDPTDSSFELHHLVVADIMTEFSN